MDHVCFTAVQLVIRSIFNFFPFRISWNIPQISCIPAKGTWSEKVYFRLFWINLTSDVSSAIHYYPRGQTLDDSLLIPVTSICKKMHISMKDLKLNYDSNTMTDNYMIFILATSWKICASFGEITFDLQIQTDFWRKRIVYSILCFYSLCNLY